MTLALINNDRAKLNQMMIDAMHEQNADSIQKHSMESAN